MTTRAPAVLINPKCMIWGSSGVMWGCDPRPNLHFFNILKASMPSTDPNNINNRLIVTQYRQVPTIAGLYCPSTQLHHLLTHSQMDLVYKNVWKSSKLHGYTFLRYYLLIEYFFNEPLEYFFEIGWNVSHCEVVRRLATFWEKPIMIGWQGGISSNPFHHHVKGSTKK